MSKRFLERSKLEFAVDDLNEVMAGAIRSIKGEGADIAINAKTVLDRLSALTNPRHSQYDKNFAEAMKDHLPQIKRVFEKANELAVHGPGGPGSLVIRGKFAAVGGGIGGALGSTFMGTTVGLPLGMGAGAAMGAKMPEYIVAGMLHPRGRRFLEFAIREGRGTISPERWATFTQIVNQQLVATGREGAMQAERLLGQREPVPQLRTRDDDELRDRAGFMERYGIR